MRQYLDLIETVLNTGEDRIDRTGVGTRSIFGYQSRYDLTEGFPLLTTKRLHLRSILEELLWFLSGSTNIEPLHLNSTVLDSIRFSSKAIEEVIILKTFL